MSPLLSDVLLSSQSDERLVALARAGHERAFVAIVERYRRELGAHARRLDSGGRAEDIVQQTFLSAFAAFRSGAEVAHLRGWLHQILRHAACRSFSRERPDAELDASQGTTQALEDAVESRMLARDLLAELARLPSRQRDAILELSIAGRSRAEVASSMGLTEGAVRQLVYRARATLRTAVTALTPYPLPKLLWAARGGASADGASEIAIGGTVSAGGAMVKLAALVASGVVATAVVAVRPRGHHPSRAAAHRITATASRQSNPPALVALTGSVAESPGQPVHPGALRNASRGAGASGGRADGGIARASASDGSRGAHGSRGVPGPTSGLGGGSPRGPGEGPTSSGGDGGSPAGGGGDDSSGASGPTTSGGDGSPSASGTAGSGGAGGSQRPSTDGGGLSSSGSSSPGGSGTDGGTQPSSGVSAASGGLSSDITASSGGSGSDGGGGNSDSGSVPATSDGASPGGG